MTARKTTAKMAMKVRSHFKRQGISNKVTNRAVRKYVEASQSGVRGSGFRKSAPVAAFLSMENRHKGN